MLRFALVVLAVFLAIRIIRGVLRFLFPPVDPSKGTQSDSQKPEPPAKPAEYKDVKDAKFKDL
ncbi:MAG TPA: hypothetical protein VII11_01560 [Bacteroidota bacterium]